MACQVNSYHGTGSNRNRRRYKYEDSEYSKRRGITVRLLTQREIAEFQSHINRLLNPGPNVTPKFRRSVV